MSVSADPRIGTELAGYRVERLLGRGGMSVVYLATDTRLGRRVALKLLAPHLAEDARFRERFLRESRLAASLDHPNVIPVYEAGDAEGLLFIAMRYVEGTDLRKLLDTRKPLAPVEAVALLAQVAEALDAAHAQGLIHRDVKPANVLIDTHRGRQHVYLTDFGLTKQASSESGITETGQFVGTVDYVAPEQIERQSVDGRADVYSLGCVLYECLTGEPPYRSDSLTGTLWAHLSAPAPSAHEKHPELPAAIDTVIATGTAKKPGDRYPGCVALVEAAGQALGLSGQLSAPAAPARPLLRRREFLLGAAALVAAGAAVPAILLTRGGKSAGGRPAAPLTSAAATLIDPTTNEVVQAVPLSGSPSSVAVGEGAVWVASFEDGTVSRIDPQTSRVDRAISVRGSPTDIATGEGAVWVTSALEGTGYLTRIDPQASGGSFRPPLALGFQNASAVAVGERAVWVVANDVQGNALLRLDPATRQIAARIPLAGQGQSNIVAVGEGAVWVTAFVGLAPGKAAVLRLDPATNRVLATVELSDTPGAIAAGEGALWINSGPHTVSRLDPATNTVVDAIHVGQYANDIAVGDGAAWVPIGATRTLIRIDTKTRSLRTIEVGEEPVGVAVGEGGVWVVNSGGAPPSIAPL